MILEYFGEDTSTLTVRNDCCDNCAKGLSTWRLKDLYHGISSIGHYNFEKDARILLRKIEDNEVKKYSTERDAIVRSLQSYGAGTRRDPYYWNALIDQLSYDFDKTTAYIKMVPGKTQLTLSVEARKWLCTQKPLWQKPVGAIFRFLRPKSGTPLHGTRWKQNYGDKRQTVYSYSSVEDLFFGQCSHCG